MLQEGRHQRIHALLATRGRATTDGIALELKVSRETARRDVLALEVRGELRRVHGAVMAITPGLQHNGTTGNRRCEHWNT